MSPLQAGTGSPYYMAPELFQPGAVHSFASDLWALGVVLYECFAGAPPFRRELLADLQRDIETVEPPPLKGGWYKIYYLVSTGTSRKVAAVLLCCLTCLKTR